jgi:hypothetical protein
MPPLLSRRSRLALAVAAAGLIVTLTLWLSRRAPAAPPRPLTLEEVARAAGTCGWKVHGPLADPDGRGLLLIDHQANPGARVETGINQDGTLYVVEVTDPNPMYEPTWGNLRLTGSDEMARTLMRRLR